MSDSNRVAVVDSSSLALAAASNLLSILPEHFQRIILSPTVVDELVAIDVIDALVAGAVDGMIEVVSLTQRDEARSEELAATIAQRSVVVDAGAHLGEAEAIALMARPDLGAVLLLCDDDAAVQVAEEHQVPVQSFVSLVVEHCEDEQVQALARGKPRHEPSEAMMAPAPRTSGQRAEVERPELVVPETAVETVETVEIDQDTRALLIALIERGVGKDAGEVVRRAVRGLAGALLE